MLFADENVNLKKLTEVQAKEFDCLKKSTDENLKNSQKDLDSLKESVEEAQVTISQTNEHFIQYYLVHVASKSNSTPHGNT
jgi:hypothetical protein